MGEFSRRLRGLQFLFPSSGTEITHPHTLGETVSPTIEFPGKIASLERAFQITILSGNVLTPEIIADFQSTQLGSQSAINPFNLGDYWVELFAGDISHNSAAARQITMFLQTGGGAFAVEVARWTNMATAGAPGQPSGFEPIFPGTAVRSITPAASQDAVTIPRPLILPPAWRLRVLGDTAAAAYVLTLSVAAIIHPIAEPALFL